MNEDIVDYTSGPYQQFIEEPRMQELDIIDEKEKLVVDDYKPRHKRSGHKRSGHKRSGYKRSDKNKTGGKKRSSKRRYNKTRKNRR